MCMITYVPNGVDIPTMGIEAGSKSNKDGHGWAVASKRGLIVGKSMNFDQAISEFVAARAQNPGSAGLFHSRFATHGEYGLYNVHPFYTADNAVMAHNGVLPKGFLPLAGDRRSDTRIFVDTFGRPFSENTATGVPSRRAAKYLAETIGINNKLAFLSATEHGPRVRLINSDMGEWDSGVWYSNTYYRAARKYWAAGRTPIANTTPRAIGGSTGNGYPASYPYGNAYGIDRRGDVVPVSKPERYVGYSARGTYGDQVFSERTGLIPADAGSGKLEYDFRQSCPRCYSFNILEIAQVCADCRMCLDCERDLDMCICFESAKEFMERENEWSDD